MLTSLGGTGTGRPGKTLCDLPCSTIKRHNKRQLTPLCKSRFAKMMKVMSTPFFAILMALSWAVFKLQRGKSEAPSWTMEAVLIGFRDLSEISRGEGRWKTGEVCSLLSPSRGRVMKKKMRAKEEGLQKNKPQRSSRDASILSILWHAIISWHTVQPPLSGQSHLLVILTRVLFVVTSIKQPSIKRLIHILWLYFKNTMTENTVRDRSWRPPCGPVILLPLSVCFKIKWCFCKRLLPI